MNRLERAGGTGSERGQPVEVSGLPIDMPQVQAALMLAAYGATHGRKNIDFFDWEKNEARTQAEAMREWVADPDDHTTYAARYRRYVGAHPGAHVDIADSEALAALLHAIERERGEAH